MFSEPKANDRLRKALVDARHAAGLTQLDVASKLSRPQSFVSKYEQGERRLDVVEFVIVCNVLKADPHGIIKSITGHT